MKRIIQKLSFGFIALIICVSTFNAQDPPPRPVVRSKDGTTTKERYGGIDKNDSLNAEELRCRGGLQIVVVEGRTNSSNEQTSYLTVDFKPASQPAGAGGRSLQPGQCAFVNRTLRADEPYSIFQEVVYFAQTRQKIQGATVDTSPTAAERYPDAQNIPQYLSDDKNYWSFFVVQSAPLPFGRFFSSASNYWKPAPGIGDVVTKPVDTRKARTRDRVMSPVKP